MEDNATTYVWYQERYPLYPNPALDTEARTVEVLVHCPCGAGYRLRLNGQPPWGSLPPTLDISCRNCGVSVHQATSISGHSGQIFNATMSRGY